MTNTILLPSLSPTMKTGNLVKWFVKQGDKVKAGDEIAEIETDKAIMVQEAEQDGVIAAILVKQGEQNIPVNSPIAVIADEDEKFDQKDIQKITQNIQNQQKNTVQNNQDEQSIQDAVIEKIKPEKQKRIFASPLARNIARINNINLENIKNGSGPNGRIIKADVENALKTIKVNNINIKTQNPKDINDKFITKSLSNIRKIIAKRLTQAKRDIPHFYLDIECNVEKIIKARTDIIEKYNTKISVNDFIIKATAKALLLMPEINSCFENEQIIQYNNANIAVAVATREGVITPVIFNAETKTLSEIASEIKILAQKAKDKKLLPHQYEGGSFSISNLGMFGIKKFQAVINPPQTAIIAVGAIEDKIILKTIDTQRKNSTNINITKIINISMSCDHRVIDGAQAAQFLQKLKYLIEDPMHILL